MQKQDYDFIIIGGGGTGLASAMYSARLGMKTLLLGFTHGTELPIGGVITTTNLVENYPGFVKLTGFEIAKKLEEHAREYELVEIKNEKVISVKKIKNGFSVKTNKDEYGGKTILFATGTKWKKLPESVKGNIEFENRGVSYCALCMPPNEDVITNSDIKQIQEITPATRVLTKDGTYEEIGGFTSRDYDGKLVSIRPRFFNEPVTLTPEHPILTTKALRGKNINYKINPDFTEFTWKPASELEINDCVVYPIIKENKDLDFIKISTPSYIDTL